MIDDIREVYNIAKEQGWIDKILSLLKKKYNILVLGSSGVGKTNLLKSLTTLTPAIIHYSNRTESSTESHIKVEQTPFIFIDTPGQERHSSYRQRTIRENCNNLNAIINVVCYGYHEYAEGKEGALTHDYKVREDYLEKNRVREIKLTREWSTILGGSGANYRLITIVTKADLWWDKKDKVLEYYRQGDYYEGLGDAKLLEPIVIPYCSVFHKFYGEAPLAGTFDESDRSQYRANLLQALVEIVGEGGTNG